MDESTGHYFLFLFKGLIRHFRPELEERMSAYHKSKSAAVAGTA